MPGQTNIASQECYYCLLTGHCIVDDCKRKHPVVKSPAVKKLRLKKNTASFTPTADAPKKGLKTGSASFKIGGMKTSSASFPQPQSSNNLMGNLGVSSNNQAGYNQSLMNNISPQMNMNPMMGGGMNQMGGGGMMGGGYNPNNFYQQPSNNYQMNMFYQQQQQNQQMMMQEQMMQQQMMAEQLDHMMGMGGDFEEEDEDAVDPNAFVVECASCSCCKGYPYICQRDQMC
jgi:hypothetical protein